nr:uncharacterized protein LOC109152047 [Ipomoea batatas]
MKINWIFSNYRQQAIQKVIAALKDYEEISGQLVSFEKTAFYMHPRTPERVVARVHRATGCVHKSFPFTYLGCPVYVGRKKCIYFASVVDKVKAKCLSWQRRVLSKGGKADALSLPFQSSVFCSACICGVCPFGDSELSEAVVFDATSFYGFPSLGAIGVDENQGENCDCGDVSDDNCDNRAGFETGEIKGGVRRDPAGKFRRDFDGESVEGNVEVPQIGSPVVGRQRSVYQIRRQIQFLDGVEPAVK